MSGKSNKSMARTQKTAAKSRPSQAANKSQNAVTIARSQRTINRPASVSGSPFSGDGRIRVRHREFLGDLSGSTAFTVTSFAVNPGLVGTFPWGSGVARLYESYQFENLSVEYETACASTTAGSVMIAIDYDAAETAPATKQELLAYHNAVRSAAWEECCFRADHADLAKFGTQRYVRTAANPANTDIKTYDVGNIYVATSGMSGSAAVGELYVTYDVVLMTPQLLSPSTYADSSAKIVNGGGLTLNAPFNGCTLTGSAVASATSDTITFAGPGEYLVTLELVGTTCNATGPTFAGTSTVGGLGPAFLVAGNTASLIQVRVASPSAGSTLTVDLTSGCAAASDISLRVATYEYSL